MERPNGIRQNIELFEIPKKKHDQESTEVLNEQKSSSNIGISTPQNNADHTGVPCYMVLVGNEATHPYPVPEIPTSTARPEEIPVRNPINNVYDTIPGMKVL